MKNNGLTTEKKLTIRSTHYNLKGQMKDYDKIGKPFLLQQNIVISSKIQPMNQNYMYLGRTPT